MAAQRKKKSIKTKKVLSSKDRAAKRAVRINRIVQMKRQAKRAKKAGLVPYKKKQQLAAESQLVEAQEPVFQDSATNAQLAVLRLLNLTSSEGRSQQFADQLEKKLEQKLQQLDQSNLENPEVRRVYTEIGQIFSTYRSGKIPRAFKVIPKLVKWKQVLAITKPQNWTPHAMFQATKMFASNFDSMRAETFFIEYLLPAVRQDLKKNKKLNYHYFEALKKAIYKTNAWFQAFVLQPCQGNEVSSREIQIVQTLLKQLSIPPLSSAVAMLKLMQITYSPPVIHYLKALIEKRYKLPRRVVDGLADFFLRFQNYQSELTIAWQQAFLSFCSQYGSSLDEMMKVSLKMVAQKHKHYIITAEIVKNLI